MLNNDVAHKVSRTITSEAASRKVKVIVFEDLKKCVHDRGKKKKTNFRLGMFMRRKIQKYTTYKAGLNGVPVVTVDLLHTSQRCPKCSHTKKKNRRGISFSCKHCRYSNNADRVGSINIAQKFLGAFVEQKFSANITHVNGWRAVMASKEEGAPNFGPQRLEAYELVRRYFTRRFDKYLS